MLEKIIKKLFFKKIVFKIFIVLSFFLGLYVFTRMCVNYTNPYRANPLEEYDNFIQFVDESLAPDIIYNNSYIHSKYLSDAAFIRQAGKKEIFSGSLSNLSFDKSVLLEKVYSCDKEKKKNFENKYKSVKGYDYYYYTESEYYKYYKGNIFVDCQKAKTMPLSPENYYFIKHELFPYIIASFLVIPLSIMIMWLFLRFVIISPILWVFRKDQVDKKVQK